MLPSRPFPKVVVSPESVLSAVAMAAATIKAFRLMKLLKPLAVVSTGGYASTPVAWAAHALKIPIVIIEPNSIPGRANRKLGKWAYAVCVAFKRAMAFFKNAIHTGMPVRSQFKSLKREKARAMLKLSNDTFMLLIFGGSKGARKLNLALWETLERLLKDEPSLLIYHICGAHSWEEGKAIASSLSDELKGRYFVQPYRDDIPALICASDLAVSRAGAGSIAELLIAGVPSILVPYPYAVDDHQRYNALEVTEAGAAITVSDEELNGDLLHRLVRRLIGDADSLERMRKAALSIAKSNATEMVADVVLRAAGLDLRVL